MLVLKKVSHAYPGETRAALSDVSLRVDAGEVVGVVGPEGAGKSTLVRILGGLIRSYGGDVLFEGRELKEWSREYFERIGVCLERPGYSLKLTATENLEYFAELYGGEKAAVAGMLEKVGINPGDGRRVERFSAAERKCLGIARALLHRPKALFLDEPLAGLEPDRAERIREMIVERKRAGAAVILVAGSEKSFGGICGRVAGLEDGRLQAGLEPKSGAEGGQGGEPGAGKPGGGAGNGGGGAG